MWNEKRPNLKMSVAELESAARLRLDAASVPSSNAAESAWACAWLEACGYPGVKLLGEALRDERREVEQMRDGLGIDLKNISCVWLAPRLVAEVQRNGRVFLRNVRHGLYLLPFAVRADIAIGCPVDPAFALGGERTGNPYAEKLALAAANGVEIDDESRRLLIG
jgi:hypothetical protein